MATGVSQHDRHLGCYFGFFGIFIFIDAFLTELQ